MFGFLIAVVMCLGGLIGLVLVLPGAIRAWRVLGHATGAVPASGTGDLAHEDHLRHHRLAGHAAGGRVRDVRRVIARAGEVAGRDGPARGVARRGDRAHGAARCRYPPAWGMG